MVIKDKNQSEKIQERENELQNVCTDDNSDNICPVSHTTNQGEENQKSDYTMDDVGNATAFIEQHGDEVRFNHLEKKWYIWNGMYWEIDKTCEIKRKAEATLQSICNQLLEESSEDDEQEKCSRLQAWIKKCRTTSTKESMLKEVSYRNPIPVIPSMFDQDQFLLNCPNGTINLRTGELKVHDKNDLITKCITTMYDPNAECPTWLNFLNKIMDGNQNLINFLQTAIGYSITGNTDEHCIFICNGSGANGKSTFVNIIQELLGDYSCTTPMKTLLAKKNEGINNDVARLFNRRFVVSSEVDESKKLAESTIKALTGQDKIAARFLFKEYFEFNPALKIWLTVNYLPDISGTDYGIWRRIRLIPFNVKIDENERDPQLKDKLRSELSGILTWCLAGTTRWQSEGLKTPKEVEIATQEYQKNQDTFQLFLNECTITDPLSITTFKNIYAVYIAWCKSWGMVPYSPTKVGLLLTEKGYKDGKKNGDRARTGLRIKDNSEYR